MILHINGSAVLDNQISILEHEVKNNFSIEAAQICYAILYKIASRWWNNKCSCNKRRLLVTEAVFLPNALQKVTLWPATHPQDWRNRERRITFQVRNWGLHYQTRRQCVWRAPPLGVITRGKEKRCGDSALSRGHSSAERRYNSQMGNGMNGSTAFSVGSWGPSTSVTNTVQSILGVSSDLTHGGLSMQLQRRADTVPFAAKLVPSTVLDDRTTSGTS